MSIDDPAPGAPPVDVAPAESPAPSLPAESPSPSLPAVLAVVVAHDPGEWFAESLAALAGQTYSRLSVLVVDTGANPVADRVHEVLPDAEVERRNAPGFGASANILLELNLRASLWLLLHDDVALAPDAVGHLVDEVLRSNAAVVGPKLVDWDDPTRLQHVGFTIDKFGVPAPLAEEGELDQEQHDAVTDVFVIPGGATLVRADLFRTIGGFDDGIAFRGEDVDFCWRTQLAGGRVMIVPDAVGRHREKLRERHGTDDGHRLRARHQLRSVLSCYRWPRLALIVPQALALSLLEVVYSLVSGRFGNARDTATAWTWNLRRVGELHRRRKAIGRYRQVGDAEIRALQTRGSARLRAFVRGQIRHEDEGIASSVTAAGRGLASSLRSRQTRNAIALFGVFAAVILFGSRHLLTRPIPAVGELQPILGSTGDLWREWWTGWRPGAFGAAALPPTATALLGVGGFVTFGHLGLLRTLLVLLPVPVGALGLWRLTRPFGSRRAAMVGVVVYLAVPVPYDALAIGSLSTLVVYAASPWLLSSLARAQATGPYAVVRTDGGVSRGRPRWRRHALGVALILAAAAAFVPLVLPLAIVIVLALVLGSLVAGDVGGLGRLVGAGTVGVVLAVALHLPWISSVLAGGRDWAPIGAGGTEAGTGQPLYELVTFGGGPTGGVVFGAGFLVAGALALLIGQEWRLSWAVRSWFVAVAAWGVAWASVRGWLPFGIPSTGLLLAVAALGLSVAVALGVVAFERDLRTFRLGLRQFTPVIAVAALVLATVPLLGAAIDGRWAMPRQDFTSTYGFLNPGAEGAYRVLWLGDGEVLPVAGNRLDGPTAFGVTQDRAPSMADRWGLPLTAGPQALRDLLRTARDGGTSRLGRALAPFGIRYVIVPSQRAPEPYDRDRRPLDPAYDDALAAQLDLERVEGVNGAVAIYRNRSWVPVNATLAIGADLGPSGSGLTGADRADLSSAAPALTDGHGPYRFTGPLAGGGDLHVAVEAGSAWDLRVGGTAVPRRSSFGWSSAYAPGQDGNGELSVPTSADYRAEIVAQAAAWLLLAYVANAWRSRAKRP